MIQKLLDKNIEYYVNLNNLHNLKYKKSINYAIVTTIIPNYSQKIFSIVSTVPGVNYVVTQNDATVEVTTNLSKAINTYNKL